MTAAAHRRPGTAVSAKGRATSEQILDAATALLLDEGYGALSTRKIASLAGIRPGNLQYYYPTKQDVIRALLERWLARSLAAVERRMDAGRKTPEERIAACIDGLLEDQGAAGACRVFWEIWALAARDRAVGKAIQRFYARYRDGIAALLLAASPDLGRGAAARRAGLVVAMVEGLTVFRLGIPREALADPSLARELRAFVLRLTREASP